MAGERLGKGGKFVWLKRTHGHPLTGPEFRVLVSIFNATGSDGRNAHPGIDRLIEETGYRRTGVSEAVSGLRAKGWVHQLYRGNGKSGRASVFDLVPDAPNPEYRCPQDRATACSTCSNSSARADVLTPAYSSATADVLGSNSSGIPDPVPGETGPIVPPGRTPSDLLSDPLGVLSERPSDPSRSSGNENRNRGALSETCGLGVRGRIERAEPSEGRLDSEGLPTREHEAKNASGDGPPGLLGLDQLVIERSAPQRDRPVEHRDIPGPGEPEFDPFDACECAGCQRGAVASA